MAHISVVRSGRNSFFAHVYLARDAFSGRDVALKVIKSDYFKHPEFQRVYRPQFEVEASLAGKLEHPHIVAIYDAVQVNDAAHAGWLTFWISLVSVLALVVVQRTLPARGLVR